MKLRAFLPIGVLALSALVLATGTVIKRTPKVGDKANYKLSGNFELQGAEIVLTGTTVEEVTKVDADQYTTKNTATLSVNVMGQDMAQPASTETMVTKLDGTIVSVGASETPEGAGMRLAHMNTLYLPAKELSIGDVWKLEAKKDEKLDTPGYKLDYKLEGEEKVGKYDTWKITSNGGEIEGDTPTKVKATYWIDKATGQTIHSLTELTDAVFRPEIPPISGKMDVTRQD